MRPPCNHPGCPHPHAGRGYCSAHLQQWYRTGTTREIGLSVAKPLWPRLMAQVEQRGECLIWTGLTMKNGYATICWNGKRWLIHRAAWTHSRGPIPDGLTIDHLCRNRACINVGHMEIVTRGENSRRGGGLVKAEAVKAARTTCKRGHPWDENRRCRVCQNAGWWRWAVERGRKSASQIPEHLLPIVEDMLANPVHRKKPNAVEQVAA